MKDHIHQSNLIENIDDEFEDKLSLLAWKYLSAQKRLSYNRVMQVHQIVTLNQLKPEYAGSVRRVRVWVGNRSCPEPYEAFGRLKEWINNMQGWRKLDPRTMHIEFEHIHPFIDGNGRTGRLLMWWHEMKLGLEPTLITYGDRQDYYRWFKTEAQVQAEAERFLDMLARNIKDF